MFGNRKAPATIVQLGELEAQIQAGKPLGIFSHFLGLAEDPEFAEEHKVSDYERLLHALLSKVRAGTLTREEMQEMLDTPIVIDAEADPVIPHEGWTVYRHQRLGKIKWDPKRVKLYLHPRGQDGCGSANGTVLMKHFETCQVLNANVMHFLMSNPRLVPESMKKPVTFWGTIYRDTSNELRVPTWWRSDEYFAVYNKVTVNFDCTHPAPLWKAP